MKRRKQNRREPQNELQVEDDFGEEQFFAAARAAYWKAGEGTSGRALAATLIQALDF